MLKNKFGNADPKKIKDNLRLLETAKGYYDSLANVRGQAITNRQMLQGIQYTSEELDSIDQQGRLPITQNIIAQMMTNLRGQYLSTSGQPVAVARKKDAASEGKLMSLAIEHAIEINNDTENDTKQFVKLATAGLICSRVDFDYISDRDREDIISQNINIHTLFFTPVVDDGGIENIDMIGTICEDSIDGVIVSFAKNEKDAEFIKEIYRVNGRDNGYHSLDEWSAYNDMQNADKFTNMDFYISNDYNKCRFYEVWTKERRMVIRYHDTANGTRGVSEYSMEEIALINSQRIEQAVAAGMNPEDAKLINAKERWEFCWMYRYITPTGHILAEGMSPFKHQSHPYILAFYDIYDGKIQPMVSNVVPMQRYINNLSMQMDFMMGNGAKGMVIADKALFEEAGITERDFQKAYTSFNKALFVNVPQGKRIEDLVKQFYAQANLAPAMTIYQNFISMMQQIMGVNQAIQGQAAASGTPAARYAQETANAQLNSKPILDCFAKFKKRKYTKILKLIQQYYDEDMYVEVGGKKNITVVGDESDIDYDLTITQEQTTSNYAVTEDDKLFQFALQGMIAPKMYFQLSKAGYAEEALELLKQQEEEMKQAQMAAQQMPMEENMQGMSEEDIQAMQQMMPQEDSEIENEEPIPDREDIPQAGEDREENALLLQQLLNR